MYMVLIDRSLYSAKQIEVNLLGIGLNDRSRGTGFNYLSRSKEGTYFQKMVISPFFQKKKKEKKNTKFSFFKKSTNPYLLTYVLTSPYKNVCLRFQIINGGALHSGHTEHVIIISLKANLSQKPAKKIFSPMAGKFNF